LQTLANLGFLITFLQLSNSSSNIVAYISVNDNTASLSETHLEGDAAVYIHLMASKREWRIQLKK